MTLMAHTAALLGYATSSSFSRWFTSQYGVAPAVWRRNFLTNQD